MSDNSFFIVNGSSDIEHDTVLTDNGNTGIDIYLTLCTLSFEINESRLFDTRCLIQDVVSSTLW